MKHLVFVICVVVLFSSCGKPPPVTTTTNPELPLTGRETWIIDGENHSIEGTAILILGTGKSMFIVKSFVDFPPDASHEPIARLLAKHAVDNKFHNKVNQAVSDDGLTVPFSGHIGVALMQQYGVDSARVIAGYRYNFSVDELAKEID